MRRHFSTPLPLDGGSIPARVAITGEPALMGPELERVARERIEPGDRLNWLEDVLQPRSFLAVPMRSRDEVLGVLSFSQTAQSARAFVPEDIGLAVELARRCTALLEQATSHAETARARGDTASLQRFVIAMARASTVDAVVRTIVEHGADAAASDVVNVALRLRGEMTVRVYHSSRGETAGVFPTFGIDYELPIVDTIVHNRPWFLADRDEFAKSFPANVSSLDAHGMQAVATLPLRASDGSVIGGIAFGFAEPQTFDGLDARLETVADLAAQSIDRARLFDHQRDVARTLQLALLPAALPLLDDVPIEARYIAAGDVAVGGDWYDVVRFDDGRIGLLIGDVAGRGVEAATVMGKVRHVAAALAMERESPGAVLERVNDYLNQVPARRAMVTCCYVIVDPERTALCFASAGHPPPLVVPENGPPQFLPKPAGVPLGAVAGARYEDASFVLTGRSTLVLYTDGLIERRRGSGRRIELDLPADPVHLRDLRHRLARWLDDAGVSHLVNDDVIVAMNEAVSNSALHAYSDGDGEIRVALAVEAAAVVVTVVDGGRWQPRRDDHDGRGLELIRALMSDVHIERTSSGTLVRMTREL